MKTVFKDYEIENPLACVFVVHGMQEHKDRYDDFAKYLNSRGIACIAYDLPGHGRECAKEDLGWFGEKDGWKVLEDSAYEIASYAKNKYQGVPVILFGHSMGAIIARTFMQENDDKIDGVILSGAPCYVPASKFGIRIANGLGKLKGAKGKSKLLDAMVTGNFNKSVEHPKTYLDWLSYNEENVRKYIADEYCGVPFTIRGYRDLFYGIQKMNRKKKYKCQKLSLPILFMAGKDDPCIGGMKGFMKSVNQLKKIGYHNVKYKIYDGMRHEILNEKDAQSVMEDVCVWIKHEFDQ